MYRWLLLLVVGCRDAETPPPRPPPREPAVAVTPTSSATEVVQLAVGAHHTCALHADHTVSCWGSNSTLQLGTKTPGDRARPAPVAGIHDAVELSAASDRTCVRHANGTVACWGQLAPTSIVAEPSLLPISAVAQLAGRCLRTTAGEVYCLDGVGQLVRIPDIADATDVASWDRAGCAVRADGTVSCWHDPSEIVAVPELNDVVQVGVGDNFACARLQHGDVTCFDWRGPRHLRRHPMRASLPVPDPPSTTPAGTRVHQDGVTGARSLVVGASQACAQAAEGLVCWMAHNAAAVPHGLEGAVAVALAVGEHVCVARGGREVLCWGPGGSGQLGNGWGASHPAPVAVPGIDDAIEIEAAVGGSASTQHTCALRRGGTVACWGEAHGETRATPRDIPNLHDIVHLGRGAGVVALDREHHVWDAMYDVKQRNLPPIAQATDVCAVTLDGHVVCTPSSFGATDGAKSVGDAVLMPKLDDVVEVGTGSTACARRKGGSIVCFSRGMVEAPVFPDAIGMGLGEGAGCAVRADHALWCWGMSGSRILREQGAPTGDLFATPPTAEPVHEVEPAPFGGLTAIASVSVANDFACAVRLDGTVACWGDNTSGQLGDGTLVTRSTPRPVPGLRDVVAVSTGFNFACALHRAGTVDCWGGALRGQLGTYTMDRVDEPARVAW